MNVAIDAMGGDHGLSVTIPASIAVIKKHSDLKLFLVGDKPLIEKTLKSYQYPSEQIEIRHASEVVLMDEKPSDALRRKKDSSMRVAINLVKNQDAHACVSAGNTGALMAISRFVLKTHANIDRPAIVTTVPTVKGHCHLLDMGANVDCSALQLFQFAVMGSILSEVHDDISQPKVGLLNIGEEELKGNSQIQEAQQLLIDSKVLNYTGFVEGDGIGQGEVDVVVADGFVGNIALKTMEGTGKLIKSFIQEAATKNIFMKLVAILSLPLLKALAKRIDPEEYNGASLVGLKGIVIKSHGSVGERGFEQAINVAVKEIRRDVPGLIKDKFDKLIEKSSIDQDAS